MLRIPFLIGKCFNIKLTFIVNISAIKSGVKFCHPKQNVISAKSVEGENHKKFNFPKIPTISTVTCDDEREFSDLDALPALDSIISVALLWLQQSAGGATTLNRDTGPWGWMVVIMMMVMTMP